MKKLGQFLVSRLFAGLLILTPIYLAILLLLKAMSSLTALVKPIVRFLPEWLPANNILELLLVLLICFVVGLAVLNPAGQTIWQRLESAVFDKIPGYTLVRSFTQQLAGNTKSEAWQPALAEIEDALVPAFIIEKLADGRLTVFVPSAPTALAGSIYILSSNRVHRVNVPVTHAIRTVSRWGSGSKDLVAAIER